MKMRSGFSKAKRQTTARIAHLTTVHSPSDVRIFVKECAALARAEYKVTLIVADNDHELTVNRVRIRKVPKANNRFRRMTLTVWRVLRAALNEKADCYHFHDPELIPAGVLLKLLGRRVVYDVHENVPEDVLNKTYLPLYCRKMVGWLMGGVEHLASVIFDGIVAATPVIARRFPASKTVAIQNFPILDELVAITALPYPERPHLITYVGGIAAIRGIEEMVRAMALIPANLNARLGLAGNFSPANLEYVAKQWPGWQYVDFLGWQSRSEVAKLLGRARMGLVLYHAVPGCMEAQPTKLFEYMSAGIPVVVSDFPVWRDIIETVDCGFCVDPRDSLAIARAITWMIDHPKEAEAMGQRGAQAVKNRFHWGKEAEKLIGFYRTLFTKSSTHSAKVEAFDQSQST